MVAEKYNLRILPLFEDDLNAIVDYIMYNLNNPNAAQTLVDNIDY